MEPEIKIDEINRLEPIDLDLASNRTLKERINVYMGCKHPETILNNLEEIENIRAVLLKKQSSLLFKWFGWLFWDLKAADLALKELDKKFKYIVPNIPFKKFTDSIEDQFNNENMEKLEQIIEKKQLNLENENDLINIIRIKNIIGRYNKTEEVKFLAAIELVYYCKKFSEILTERNEIEKSNQYLEKAINFFKIALNYVDKINIDEFSADNVRESMLNFKIELLAKKFNKEINEEINHTNYSFIACQLAKKYENRDPNVARQLYKDSGDEGNEEALLRYAEMCLKGEGGEKNLDEANDIYYLLKDSDDDKISEQACKMLIEMGK